ncbi:MAG: Rieske (2Fe-2S) protein [Gemmatimonadota bacterium]|nr:Rieske (2Fe-2S) protein [Gemmatimonadota bacterium]MDH5197204.1 Rieske (2Fe-2S) protein [Gemmatimonadota bacterium]
MSDAPRPRSGTRRGFLDWLLSRTLTTWILSTSLGGLIVAVIYPVGRYLMPPASGESAASSVTLPYTPDELAPNSAKIFKFGNRPGIIVRTATGELRAFSAACTHLGCIVQLREDLGHFWCACHNGHFDLNGVNIQGPPPRPLDAFEVNVRGDQIVVSKGA